MKTIKLPLIVSTALLAPAAWTQDLPAGPVAELQAEVAGLAARVSELESAAPSSSVEGRTYCFVLDLTDMRGIGVNQTERLFTSIIRRTATFDSGAFAAPLLSHVRNTQGDDGVVTPSVETSPDPLLGSYMQTGNRLDMAFTNGTTATWYVSQDGSLISGTSITSLGPVGTGQVTIGQTRHWTLVESANCLAELM